MPFLVINLVVFFAVFTQSVVGFGMTLVAMPLLGAFYELKLISPLIAVVGIVAKALLLVKYHSAFEFKTMWRFTLASLIFVPVGVYALETLDDEIAMSILGGIVLVYAIYSLFGSTVLRFAHNFWAYLFGAIAGLLGGAFNASGLPVVVYASSRPWGPIKFKSNLQGYALVNGLFITINHYLSGNMTGEVWQIFLYSIPAIIIGVIAGVSLDKFINPEVFRKAVLYLLIVLGLRLLIV